MKSMEQLALASGLTAKSQQLCIGLEDGVADIFDLVTPMTAELLHWWFGEDACLTRRLNFHPGRGGALRVPSRRRRCGARETVR